MTRKVKKSALGVVCALLATIGAVGVVSLTKPTAPSAVAEGNTFSVDVLGNATWTATENATAYQWSYTVDGIVYPSVYTTTKNGAFIGEALTRAAQSAKAKNTDSSDANDVTALDVTLNVAPIVDGVLGEPVSLTPTTAITQYINYGYETHDITEYSTKAQGDGYSFGRENGSYYSPTPTSRQINATKAMKKNQLLTFGWDRIEYVTANSSYLTYFAFFGGTTSNSPAANTCNYHLLVYCAENSNVIAKLSVDGTQQKTYTNAQAPFSLKTNYTDYGKSTNYGGSKTSGTTYHADAYVTCGVFDVYDVNGVKAGEQFYFDYDVMKSNVLTDVTTLSEFFDTTVTSGLTYTGTTSGTNGDYGIGSTNLNIAGGYCKGTLHSGTVEDDTPIVEESPITGVYYDNTDASINWNKVEGADSYEYAIGNGAWTAVSTNYVSVVDEIVNYSNYMPVKIRAIVGGVASKEVYYNARMGYKDRSTVKDLMVEVRGGSINDYAGGITGTTDNAIKNNSYLTFSYKPVDGDRFLALYSKMTGAGDATNTCYALNFWENGVISVGMDAFGYYNSPSFDSKRVVDYFDVMESSTKYFVTFGVDDIYEDDVKVSEYVTLRVAVQDSFGEFKTVALSNFENTNFATDAIDTTNKTYTLWGKSAISSSIVYNKMATTVDLGEGAIKANAYMNIASPNRVTFKNLKVKTVYNGETAVNVTQALPEVETEGWKAGLYKFSQEVPAKEIDKTVSLTLYVGSKACGVSYTFAVRDYINAVQETYLAETGASAETLTYSQEVYDLVTAMEDYADATAVYFGVEGATLDSTRIDSVGDVFTQEYSASGTDATIENVGFTLLTETKTVVRLYIQATAMPTVTATVGGETREVSVETMGSGNAVYYYVDVEVNAFELDSNVVFTINGGATFTCSALTYGTYVDNANVNLANVVKALYNYAQKATAWQVAQN